MCKYTQGAEHVVTLNALCPDPVCVGTALPESPGAPCIRRGRRGVLSQLWLLGLSAAPGGGADRELLLGSHPASRGL